MKKILFVFIFFLSCSRIYADTPSDIDRLAAINDSLTNTETSLIDGSLNTSQVEQQNAPRGYKKHNYELAFQIESYNYKTGDKWPYYYSTLYSTSDKVEKSGSLYGLYASKSWNLYAPLHTWSDLWKNYEIPNFVKIEVEASTGGTDYSSYVTGKLKGFESWDIDGRLLAGYNYAWSDTTSFTPYIGVGYRRFIDNSGGYVDYFVNGYAKYTNINSMFYIPIGVETHSQLNERWDMNLKVEADIVAYGTTDYLLNDIHGTFPGTDVNTGAPLTLSPKESNSNLKGGFGFRTSIKLIRKYKYCNFFVEPFFKLLYLNKSDPVQASSFATNNGSDYVSVYPNKSAYKPLWDAENTTIDVGARAGVEF